MIFGAGGIGQDLAKRLVAGNSKVILADKDVSDVKIDGAEIKEIDALNSKQVHTLAALDPDCTKHIGCKADKFGRSPDAAPTICLPAEFKVHGSLSCRLLNSCNL